jgi:hypothetical protein
MSVWVSKFPFVPLNVSIFFLFSRTSFVLLMGFERVQDYIQIKRNFRKLMETTSMQKKKGFAFLTSRQLS